MIGFKTNPTGAVYRQLIDYAADRVPYFILADRDHLTRSGQCRGLFTKLEPFIVSVHTTSELSGRNEIAYSAGYYYVYKCCSETATILKEASDSLYSWQHPDFPEDLCFLNRDGSDFMVTIAHEEIGYIRLNPEDHFSLPNELLDICYDGK